MVQSNRVPPNQIVNPEPVMEPDRIKAMLFQAKEYWVHSDADRFAELFVPDGELVREGQHWQGREAVRQAFLELLDTLVIKHVEVQRVLINGNTAVMEWIWETTDKDTGEHCQQREATAVDLSEDGIICWREHTNEEQSLETA